MMEDGYNPEYEMGYIEFDIKDNRAVLEYEKGILSLRVFFSINEEEYDLLLETSNASMLETSMVKSILLDNMKTIMFSCEMMCDNVREFRKFFPRGIRLLKQGIIAHKEEAGRIMLAEKISSATISAAEDTDILSPKTVKMLS